MSRTKALKAKWSAAEGARNSTCSPEAHEIYELAEALEKALRDLVDAEEEYGDPDNVAVNEAWDKARRVLDQ